MEQKASLDRQEAAQINVEEGSVGISKTLEEEMDDLKNMKREAEDGNLNSNAIANNNLSQSTGVTVPTDAQQPEPTAAAEPPVPRRGELIRPKFHSETEGKEKILGYPGGYGKKPQYGDFLLDNMRRVSFLEIGDSCGNANGSTPLASHNIAIDNSSTRSSSTLKTPFAGRKTSLSFATKTSFASSVVAQEAEQKENVNEAEEVISQLSDHQKPLMKGMQKIAGIISYTEEVLI